MKNKVQTLFEALMKRFRMRCEQEMMVLRYALLCKPSVKTIAALVLRVLILFSAFLVFSSILLSYQFIDSIAINITVLAIFLWIVARFLWEFGYTIQHVRRYASWLAMLLLLPLPLYFVIYSNSFEEGVDRFVINNSQTQRLSTVKSGIKQSTASFKVNSVAINSVRGTLNLRSSELGLDEGIAPAIEGRPLMFPNPLPRNTVGEIGYDLSKDMDVEIKVYNMFGHLVRQMQAYQGEQGGRTGEYNRVPFDGKDESGRKLGAGAYFYLIVHNGDVLGKGKIAILP
jgi:hypothetical protein